LDYERAYRRLSDVKQPPSQQEIVAISDEFASSLLGAEGAPEEYVVFICRVLASPTLVNRPGLEDLVITLWIDREQLTPCQLRRVGDCAASQFGLVTNEDMALVIGDFVARVMAPPDALRLLRAMTAVATSRAALAGVFLGLDILRRHSPAPSAGWLDAVAALNTMADERLNSLEQT
jgi:hypothetical protein